MGLGCPPGAAALPWRLLSWARACWMPAGLLWITWSRRKTAELLGGGGGRGSPGGRSSGGRLKKIASAPIFSELLTLSLPVQSSNSSLFPVKIQVFLSTSNEFYVYGSLRQKAKNQGYTRTPDLISNCFPVTFPGYGCSGPSSPCALRPQTPPQPPSLSFRFSPSPTA